LRSAGPVLPGLSGRESEVLELVARGLDNHEVARSLYLSVKTVQNHVSMLLTKTGARSRAHLVALARDAGIG
jgi:DNA-binding NarL/FixJ family response regulator